MAMTLPHFLFTLERYDRACQSVRAIGGVIIALEDPVLRPPERRIGQRRALSELVVPGRMTERLIVELEKIGQQPGSDVTRDHEELFILFDDLAMTERGTKAAFIRIGPYT